MIIIITIIIIIIEFTKLILCINHITAAYGKWSDFFSFCYRFFLCLFKTLSTWKCFVYLFLCSSHYKAFL